jgi:hypothetical protein
MVKAMKSARNPKVPSFRNLMPSSLGTSQRKVLLVGLACFFILALATTLVLAYYVFEPEINAVFASLASKSNNAPGSSPITPSQAAQNIQPEEMNLPRITEDCARMTLALGNERWSIQSVQQGADGSINIPPESTEVAYWIETIKLTDVLALSPTPANLDRLGSRKQGEEASLTWQDCTSKAFILASPEEGASPQDVFLGQEPGGLIVYIPESPSSPGMVVRGVLTGETIVPGAVTEPGNTEVSAEISLEGYGGSADGKNLEVTVSIHNYGAKAITLSDREIRLSSSQGENLPLISSEPGLPSEISPGESRSFSLEFPLPAAKPATLKIYSVEYELEDF